MPWRATSPMEQRIRFVKDARTGLYTMRELCERYNVSRKTGYKWTARFEAEGVAGLADRSRAPHSPERRMSEAAREALLEVRRKHPSWGPRKILAWLEARHARTAWPAASSVGELLRREGLVAEHRRRPRREPHPGPPQIAAKEPNDLWTTDFKGQFPTKNGWWCYPLTVLDHASRMCLALDGLGSPDGGRAGPVFERAFREFGLPRAILSDNGAPFAAAARPARAHQAQRLVAQARDPADPHGAREPGTERRARALPSHAQGGDRQAAGGQSKRATATLQPLPRSLQRRATARGARPDDARFALPLLTSPLSRVRSRAPVREHGLRRRGHAVERDVRPGGSRGVARPRRRHPTWGPRKLLAWLGLRASSRPLRLRSLPVTSPRRSERGSTVRVAASQAGPSERARKPRGKERGARRRRGPAARGHTSPVGDGDRGERTRDGAGDYPSPTATGRARVGP